MKITTLGSALAAVAASTGVEMRTSPFIQEAEAIGVVECVGFDGTVVIQSSDDDSTYTTVMTVDTSAGTGDDRCIHEEITMKRYMRANVTAYTAGSCNVKLIA